MNETLCAFFFAFWCNIVLNLRDMVIPNVKMSNKIEPVISFFFEFVLLLLGVVVLGIAIPEFVITIFTRSAFLKSVLILIVFCFVECAYYFVASIIAKKRGVKRNG